MKRTLAYALTLGLTLSAVRAQVPVVSSLYPDGTITWTNMSTNCVAVVEEYSQATSGQWVTVYAEVPTTLVSSAQLTVTNAEARFRVVNADSSNAPEGMALVPGGWFTMGDNLRDSDPSTTYIWETPVHAVYISPFYCDQHEVTKALWDEVCSWAQTNDYGTIRAGIAKGVDHPVAAIDWLTSILWCNARSEMEGLDPVYFLDSNHEVVHRGAYSYPGTVDTVDWSANGYRLPTEAEWEKAARGGLNGQRFPWGDCVDHSRANYLANGDQYTYDESPYSTGTYHPDYYVGEAPFTAPVGSFAANRYGLHDVSGNVMEWCWDAPGVGGYVTSQPIDPTGRPAGSPGKRISRGGCYVFDAYRERCAFRYPYNGYFPEEPLYVRFGLRCVRRP